MKMFNRVGGVLCICVFALSGAKAGPLQAQPGDPTERDFLTAICSDYNLKSSTCRSLIFETGYDSSCEVEVTSVDKLINGGVLYFIVEIGSRDQTCWNPHTGFLDGIVIFSRDKDKKVKYITYFEGDSLDRNCVKAPLEKNGEEVLFCMNFFADQGGTHNQYLERFGEVGPGDGKRAYALEQNITAATMYPADQSYGIECNQKPVRMFFDFDQLRYSQQTHRLEMEVVYADPEQIVEACSDPSRKFLPLTGKPTTSISIDARRALKGTLEYDYLRGKIRLINHR